MKRLNISIFVFLIFSSFFSRSYAMEELQEQTVKVNNLCLFIDIQKKESVEKELNSIAAECAIVISRETAPMLIFDSKIFDIIAMMRQDFIDQYVRSGNPSKCKILDLTERIKKQFTKLKENKKSNRIKNAIIRTQTDIRDKIKEIKKKKYDDNLLCYLALNNFDKQNVIYKVYSQNKKSKQHDLGYLIIPNRLILQENLTQESDQNDILTRFMFNNNDSTFHFSRTNLEQIIKKTEAKIVLKSKMAKFNKSILNKLLLDADKNNLWHVYWTGHGSRSEEIGGVKFKTACSIAKILEQKNTALLYINSCYFGDILANKILTYLSDKRDQSDTQVRPMYIASLAVADLSTSDWFASTYNGKTIKSLLDENTSTQDYIEKQLENSLYPFVYDPNIRNLLESLESLSDDLGSIDEYHFGGTQVAIGVEPFISLFKEAFENLVQTHPENNSKVLTNSPQLFIPDIKTNDSIIPVDSDIVIISKGHIERKATPLSPNKNISINNKRIIVIDSHKIDLPLVIKNIPMTTQAKPNCMIIFKLINNQTFTFQQITAENIDIKTFIFKILFHHFDADYLKKVTVVIDHLILKNTETNKIKSYKNIIAICFKCGEIKALGEQILRIDHTLPIKISRNRALSTYKKGSKVIKKNVAKIKAEHSKYGPGIDAKFIESINKENINLSNLQG